MTGGRVTANSGKHVSSPKGGLPRESDVLFRIPRCETVLERPRQEDHTGTHGAASWAFIPLVLRPSSEFKDCGSLTDGAAGLQRYAAVLPRRNEHLVAAIKHGRKALCTQWRGSFLGLAAVGAAYVLW